MEEKEHKGSCLCGSVTFKITPPYIAFQYCYCSRCRKITGSAHASNIIMPPENFHWTQGKPFVGRYEPGDAKHFATCFCKKCGSTLPWITKSNKAMIVPAGSLDTGPEIKPENSLFWNSRANWYVLPHTLNTYPTLPRKSKTCKIDGYQEQ